jgi:hypothetical protein
MRTARTLLALAAVLTVLTYPARVRANFTVFDKSDPGAGPGAPAPNSASAALAFATAAGQLGTVTQTSFGNTIGYKGPVSIAPGVSLSLSGADLNGPAGYIFGITTDHPSVSNGYDDQKVGGSFLRLVPDAENPSVTATSATITFKSPVQAFGLYITGLGTAAGNLEMLISGGSSSGVGAPGGNVRPASVQDLGGTSDPSTPTLVPIAGNPAGGVQFFGFTDPGASITTITLQMTGFTSTSRDVIGLDGISLVAVVPEPSPFLLFSLGALVLLGSHRLTRSRAG